MEDLKYIINELNGKLNLMGKKLLLTRKTMSKEMPLDYINRVNPDNSDKDSKDYNSYNLLYFGIFIRDNFWGHSYNLNPRI